VRAHGWAGQTHIKIADLPKILPSKIFGFEFFEPHPPRARSARHSKNALAFLAPHQGKPIPKCIHSGFSSDDCDPTGNRTGGARRACEPCPAALSAFGGLVTVRIIPRGATRVLRVGPHGVEGGRGNICFLVEEGRAKPVGKPWVSKQRLGVT